jgi:hypothetical protein
VVVGMYTQPGLKTVPRFLVSDVDSFDQDSIRTVEKGAVQKIELLILILYLMKSKRQVPF